MTHSNSTRTLILPVLMIAIGTGWLLTTQGIVPAVDWVWTLGLLAIGLLTFVVGGVDKVTIVLGPLFFAAAALSVFRQIGRLGIDTEVPLLVILSGVLLLVARHSAIPSPAWLIPERAAAPKRVAADSQREQA